MIKRRSKCTKVNNFHLDDENLKLFKTAVKIWLQWQHEVLRTVASHNKVFPDKFQENSQSFSVLLLVVKSFIAVPLKYVLEF